MGQQKDQVQDKPNTPGLHPYSDVLAEEHLYEDNPSQEPPFGHDWKDFRTI